MKRFHDGADEDARPGTSGHGRETRWRRLLLGLLAAACVVTRVAHIERERNFAPGAGVESEQIARNLLAGRGYSLRLAWGPREFTTAHMPPGLPAVLAGLYWLPLEQPHRVFEWLQAALSGVTLLALWSLGRRAFSEPVAWLAAALFLFDLNLSFTATWVQETAINVLCTTLGLALVARWDESGSTRHAVFAGPCFGAGMLFRPVIGLVAIVSAVWMMAQHRSDRAAGWRAAGTLALSVALVVAPWTARNWLVFGRWIPVCQNWAINFWLGYNERAAGSQWDDAGRLLLPEGDLADRLKHCQSESEMDGLLTEDGWRYLCDHPAGAAALRPRAFLYFWLDHNYFLGNPPYRISRRLQAANVALVGLAWLGMLANARRAGVARLLLCVVIAISLFYAFFHADIGNRFRMQIEPILLLFIADFVVRIALLLVPLPKSVSKTL